MTTATPQLYVVIAAGPAAGAKLGALLGAGVAIAAVLIKAGATALDAATAHPLVELVQKANVAALIAGDAALARTLRADGVHLSWSPTLAADYAEARDILGNRFMVGVDIAGDTGMARHDAMHLAEAGADYVGFDVSGDHAEAAHELVDWWAEIFEVPCVGFGVARAEDAGPVAAADFVGITLAAGMSPADAAALIRKVAAQIDARQREVTG